MRISDWSSDVCSSDLAYRRAQLWRDIKNRIHELVDGKQLTPLWIIDEAQNLPPEFFRDFPAFLNFAFDARDLITVWLVGHPSLAQTLERAPYAALHSRIQVPELGRASCRDRVCPSVSIAVVAVSLKKKKKRNT